MMPDDADDQCSLDPLAEHDQERDEQELVLSSHWPMVENSGFYCSK